MLRIAVCVKQVPALSDGAMDSGTGAMIRTGKAVCNACDLSAVEAALRLKAGLAGGAQVDVFTMGPAGAEAAIREVYSMGADNGFLLCDRAFAGADVLATSYTLASGMAAMGGYDVILCGRQTTDGDTGQVGGAIAQWLHIPYVGGVMSIECSADGLLINQQVAGEELVLQVPFPCLLSVEREAFLPRLPNLRLKLTAAKKPVRKLTAADLPLKEPTYFGISGSATKVARIYAPTPMARRPLVRLEGAQGGAKLARLLTSLTGKEVDA